MALMERTGGRLAAGADARSRRESRGAKLLQLLQFALVVEERMMDERRLSANE